MADECTYQYSTDLDHVSLSANIREDGVPSVKDSVESGEPDSIQTDLPPPGEGDPPP